MSVVSIVVSCVVLLAELIAGQWLTELGYVQQFGGGPLPAGFNLHFFECSLFVSVCRGCYLLGKFEDKPTFRQSKLSDVPPNLRIAFAVFLAFLLFVVLHKH